MKIPFLDLSRIPDNVKESLEIKFREILHLGIFSGGKEVELFEKEIAAKLSIPHFTACSNGTDALEIALRVSGIGPGDYVAVPALTWVSTAEVVKLVGAEPVFVDTDHEGLMDLELLEKLDVSNLKAVIPVHLYGQMVDMKKLVDWAKKWGILIIEDNAQAFGSSQDGKAAGTWGDIGCFSFYPTKNLGALGEAGGIYAKKGSVHSAVQQMINHGQLERDVHLSVGKNSRIDSIQAGILRVFLQYFEVWQTTRKHLAGIYLDQLSGIEGLTLPQNCLEKTHNLHLFTIRFTERDNLREFLKEKGIGTAIHYPNILPEMLPYQNDSSFPIARSISQTTLSLPLNPFLTEEEVICICKEVKSF